jgi:hypothetical protein
MLGLTVGSVVPDLGGLTRPWTGFRFYGDSRAFGRGLSGYSGVLGLVRLLAKIVFNPESEIVTQTKEMVSAGLPVNPLPLEGWAVPRGKNSGSLDRDNGKNEEDYEEE